MHFDGAINFSTAFPKNCYFNVKDYHLITKTMKTRVGIILGIFSTLRFDNDVIVTFFPFQIIKRNKYFVYTSTAKKYYF